MPLDCDRVKPVVGVAVKLSKDVVGRNRIFRDHLVSFGTRYVVVCVVRYLEITLSCLGQDLLSSS